MCEFVRSFASGFIFTTALPPAIAAGAVASIRHLKISRQERDRQQERVASLRRQLDMIGLPRYDNPSHIAPVMVGDLILCKQISDRLLDEFGIYVQPINFPTVLRGMERLRITPSPLHPDADIGRLLGIGHDLVGAELAESGLIPTSLTRNKKEWNDVMRRHADKTTRRQIMRAGLAVAGALVAVSAKAQDKIAQAQVQYQNTPKDGNKCSTCVNFEPPNACKIVVGRIDPNGWCVAYAPKEDNKG